MKIENALIKKAQIKFFDDNPDNSLEIEIEFEMIRGNMRISQIACGNTISKLLLLSGVTRFEDIRNIPVCVMFNEKNELDSAWHFLSDHDDPYTKRTMYFY